MDRSVRIVGCLAALAWAGELMSCASTPSARASEVPAAVPPPVNAAPPATAVYVPPSPSGSTFPMPSTIPPPAAPPAIALPLLAPLIGAAAWQGEVRAVIHELIANLSPQNAERVATIPIVFDPDPNDVNAFAGCDSQGAPYVAGTEGLLEAVDAMAQTHATDELFATQTYSTYVATAAPRMVGQNGGSATLPPGIIPVQLWSDPRRLSRAHQIFDEIVAFTFGHELSHHYLGHTGCANGQSTGAGPAIAQLGILATSILPGLNQPNEIAADSAGCINVLDTGRARAAQAFRWTEEGGLWLLDFFARLEAASGASPWLGFLRTHPNPGLRIPIVQAVAATWRLQHPG